MDIKTTLKNRRIALNLTMADVADAVGVSEATVSRWESGNIANMRRDKIAALSKILQISPTVIMGWEEQPITDLFDNKTATIDRYAGQKILFLRNARKITIDDFVNGLNEQFSFDVDVNTVKKWESCSVLPSAYEIAIIANFFNVSISYFLEENKQDDKKHDLLDKLIETARPLPTEKIEILITVAQSFAIDTENKD